MAEYEDNILTVMAYHPFIVTFKPFSGDIVLGVFVLVHDCCRVS